jgi:intracellular multiplication protein IcmO
VAFQRGLSEKHERAQENILRDVRPLGMRVHDFLQKSRGVAAILLFIIVACWMLPSYCDVFFLVGSGLFLYCALQKRRLPFRMPQYAHIKDYNDMYPNSKKPRESRGIYFFGNDKETSEELWFGNDDMRTHALIFGSTGSGKTEAMVSIAYNALLQASGFIYVDGKGDNALFAKVFSMVRSMGREDDILLINFMTGARDVFGPQETRLSNTMNPFAMGSSSMLANLVVSLMGGASNSSDGDMWKGRAIGFVEALMRILTAMRDAGHILLDANTVRNYFHLNRLETLVLDKLFVRDGADPINVANLPSSILEPIENYVLNLPGYNKDKKHKQVSQVLEQHGFITMQLTRVFTSLADTYGHIMRVNLADVDLKDVVLNRRILVVLLPALEKSPDELANLGKIVIASLKAMMAAGLGENVEGSYHDLIESKPTNSDTPYLCILDEYGYYAVEGFAVVPAQARSLGFSVIFAGQDLPAFQKSSKEEAASIGANTNIKVCMKLEDPTETWDFFMKGAGESYVSHVESYQVDQNSAIGTYQDAKGARMEKRARIDLLDLKEQEPGEAHFFFKSKIVRGRFFFSNPKPVKHIRINHFLKVEPISDKAVATFLERAKQLEDMLEDVEDFILEPEDGQQMMQEIFQVMENEQVSPLQAAYKALHVDSLPQDDFTDSFFAEPNETFREELNIFMPMRRSDHVKGTAYIQDMEAFGKSLLNRNDTREYLEYCQRLLGKDSQQATHIANELVLDLQTGTDYPPTVRPMVEPAVLAAQLQSMTDAIKAKKEEAKKEKP